MLSPRHTHSHKQKRTDISVEIDSDQPGRRHPTARACAEDAGRPAKVPRPTKVTQPSVARCHRRDTTTTTDRLTVADGMAVVAGGRLSAAACAPAQRRTTNRETTPPCPSTHTAYRAAPRCRTTEAGGPAGRPPRWPQRRDPCTCPRAVPAPGSAGCDAPSSRCLAFAYGRCVVRWYLGHPLASCCGPSFPPMIDR